MTEPTYTSESAVPETLRIFCAACGHAKTHHGTFGPVTSDRFGPWKWVDSKRCYLWVGTSNRGGGGCKCRGFRAKEAGG